MPPSPRRPGRYSTIFINALAQSGVVDSYRSVRGALLLALDGTEYFSSTAIHCPHCSTRQREGGQVNYFHTALTPVLVKPGLDKVIALAPEFVQARDGAAKQDCEINAAKRLSRRARRTLRTAQHARPRRRPLYCHEAFCRELLVQKLGFILVCKPDSHALVYEWLDHLQRNGAIRIVSRTRS